MRQLLSPRALLVAVAALAASTIGLGLALAMGVNGETTVRNVVTAASCKAGEPGCTLRQAIHVHADFALFIDGQPFDFNQERFVSHDEADEKSPYVHIHPPRASVVHVHMSGTTWDEFFRSLGFELQDATVPGAAAGRACLKTPDGARLCSGEGGKTLKFYLNGIRADGIAFEEIGNLDRLLISYGAESDEQVRAEQVSRVTDQSCIPSELCIDRIPPNEPPEQCSGRGACGK